MLELKNISKRIGEFTIRNITFSVEKGDYFVLLGESGAGKSVILELIAGLLYPDSGQVFLNNIDITKQKINSREIGIVFQDFGLFPHFTVFQNIAFPLKNKHLSNAQIIKTVHELASNFEILHLLKRKPDNLSGGEKQRVAFARCLALKPKILLLDEPLSSVDIRLKDSLSKLLRNLNKNGNTIIHVTHDFDEAVSLATHIAVIDNGTLISHGLIDEVFNYPCHPFVARLAGISNFFKATINYNFKNNFSIITLQNGLQIKYSGNKINGSGFYFIHSDNIKISMEKPYNNSENIFYAKVIDIIHRFKTFEIITDCGEKFHIKISKNTFIESKLKLDDEIWISWNENQGNFILKH